MVQSVLYGMYTGIQFWKVFLLVVESVVVVVVVVVVVAAPLKKGTPRGATCNFVIRICLAKSSMDGISHLIQAAGLTLEKFASLAHLEPSY